MESKAWWLCYREVAMWLSELWVQPASCFLFYLNKQPVCLVCVFLKNELGQPVTERQNHGYLLLVWEHEPSRGHENLGKPPLSPSTRSFLVSETLPTSGNDIAKCDSLYCMMQCYRYLRKPCQPIISSKFPVQEVTKIHMLWKFKRESWILLWQCKQFTDMTALQQLSLVRFWNTTKSNSHITDNTAKELFPSLNTELGKAPVLHVLRPSQFTTTDNCKGRHWEPGSGWFLIKPDVKEICKRQTQNDITLLSFFWFIIWNVIFIFKILSTLT